MDERFDFPNWVFYAAMTGYVASLFQVDSMITTSLFFLVLIAASFKRFMTYRMNEAEKAALKLALHNMDSGYVQKVKK